MATSITTLKLKWNNGSPQLYGLRQRATFPSATTIGTGSPISVSVTAPSTSACGYSLILWNPTTGTEFSGVGGFTYNFKNPDTPVSKAASISISIGACRSFLSKQVFFGLVGYAPTSRSPTTSGSRPLLAAFAPGVLGMGPQIGIYFPDRSQTMRFSA